MSLEEIQHIHTWRPRVKKQNKSAKTCWSGAATLNTQPVTSNDGIMWAGNGDAHRVGAGGLKNCTPALLARCAGDIKRGQGLGGLWGFWTFQEKQTTFFSQPCWNRDLVINKLSKDVTLPTLRWICAMYWQLKAAVAAGWGRSNTTNTSHSSMALWMSTLALGHSLAAL